MSNASAATRHTIDDATAADEAKMRHDAEADAAAVELRLRVFDTVEAAAEPWRALEQSAVLTPYQRYDWVSQWYASRRPWGRPAIVTLFERDRPAALLPLEIRNSSGLRRARLIGAESGNSDWMIVTPGLAPQLGAERLHGLLAEAAKQAGGIDLLSFYNQPPSWGGLTNPLLALPHQPGPDHFYFGALKANGSFDRFDDKRLGNLLRRKRKLAEMMGPVSLRAASTVEEIDAVHAAFLEQRAARFAQQGIANIFGEPDFVRFMREGAIRSIGAERPVMVFHALYAGETIVATAFGTFAGNHYSQYINATAGGEIAKFRLIGILMHELFADCARRGATTVDMGLGDFDYKADWTEPQLVYDSVVPLSATGRLAAPLQLGLRRLKRNIKQNEQLFGLLKRARGLLRGTHT